MKNPIYVLNNIESGKELNSVIGSNYLNSNSFQLVNFEINSILTNINTSSDDEILKAIPKILDLLSDWISTNVFEGWEQFYKNHKNNKLQLIVEYNKLYLLLHKFIYMNDSQFTSIIKMELGNQLIVKMNLLVKFNECKNKIQTTLKNILTTINQLS